MIVAATRRRSKRIRAAASQRTRMITKESRWKWFPILKEAVIGSIERLAEKEEDGESELHQSGVSGYTTHRPCHIHNISALEKVSDTC